MQKCKPIIQHNIFEMRSVIATKSVICTDSSDDATHVREQ